MSRIGLIYPNGEIGVAQIQTAVDFVRRHGTSVEQTRLNVLMGSAEGTSEAINELARDQREDGGWAPFWAQDASSVDATCYRLAQCEQLGLTNHKMIGRAIAFLANHQHREGSLEEQQELASVAPPWALPGDLAAKIYLTANAGYWIFYYQPKALALPRIAQFLTAHIDPCGKMPSFLHAHWLTAGLLYGLGAKTGAQHIMDALRVRLSELEASNLAWMINGLSVMGVAPHSPLITDALIKLVSLQHANGHWSNEDGDEKDVHTTLEALRAISFVHPLVDAPVRNRAGEVAIPPAGSLPDVYPESVTDVAPLHDEADQDTVL